jgi:hypothetical protein
MTADRAMGRSVRTAGARVRAFAGTQRGRTVIATTAVVLAAVIVVQAAGTDGHGRVATAPPPRGSTASSTTEAVPADVATGTVPVSRSVGPVDRSLDGPPAATTLAPAPETTPPVDTAPAVDPNDPAIVARPIPSEPPPPPPEAPPPPWAGSTRSTAGYTTVDVGCASGRSAAALDAFFVARVGPVIGWDYQHVYPLGGDRYLWLFQDTFVDHSGTAGSLDRASFVHNAALVQHGTCFTLYHRGTASRPEPFEPGAGGSTLRRWYWPMGGELVNGQLHVFWAEMVKDPYDPAPPDGLGWHPAGTWLATYDASSLRRVGFTPATDSGVTPIFGYAVSSDPTHTYLFGNTFEQNMVREGGFWNGPHSATNMWLARVPRGDLRAAPEYRTADGWSSNRSDAVPILQRYYAENPMQPRYLDGQWVAATKADGYWGDHLVIDVANDPWGPWTTVQSSVLGPRWGDRRLNNYHAHVLPWRASNGQLLVSVSNNARNMLRDAWPSPERYRPSVMTAVWAAPPPPTTTTTTSTTTTSTVPPVTTTASTTTSTTSTTTSTTSTPTTSTSTPSTTAPTTSTTSTSTTTAKVAPTTTAAAGAPPTIVPP